MYFIVDEKEFRTESMEGSWRFTYRHTLIFQLLGMDVSFYLQTVYAKKLITLKKMYLI